MDNLAKKVNIRNAIIVAGLTYIGFRQYRRFKHARLMLRLGDFNVIGYQIPGGFYVSKKSAEDESTTVRDRLFIDWGCQVFKHDERLSQYTRILPWVLVFEAEYAKAPAMIEEKQVSKRD